MAGGPGSWTLSSISLICPSLSKGHLQQQSLLKVEMLGLHSRPTESVAPKEWPGSEEEDVAPAVSQAALQGTLV